MRVLHTYNIHRSFGGSDSTTAATIAVLRARGIEVEEFVRDSRDLPANLAGKFTAFAGGLYAREAVREFAEVLLRARGQWDALVEQYVQSHSEEPPS